MQSEISLLKPALEVANFASAVASTLLELKQMLPSLIEIRDKQGRVLAILEDDCEDSDRIRKRLERLQSLYRSLDVDINAWGLFSEQWPQSNTLPSFAMLGSPDRRYGSSFHSLTYSLCGDFIEILSRHGLSTELDGGIAESFDFDELFDDVRHELQKYDFEKLDGLLDIEFSKVRVSLADRSPDGESYQSRHINPKLFVEPPSNTTRESTGDAELPPAAPDGPIPPSSFQWRGERTTEKLKPTEYKVLAYIFERRENPPTVDELKKQFWPDSFNDRGSYDRCASGIRKKLQPLGATIETDNGHACFLPLPETDPE